MESESGELAFSDKYNKAHSEAYYRKHKQGFWRNRSNNREIEIARRALAAAGKPDSILDLPCGAGRFWSLLEQSGATELSAADNSESMLEVAKSSQPEEIVSKFKLLQTSAFDIKLPDDSVDCIFSMRLIHHIGESSDRLRLLKEFHRVTRETVCLSLWVDGNYQAWRRKRLETTRQKREYQNRFVIPAATIESEFKRSGFKVREYLDMTPFISMWRIYVLEK
jgi:ubiquinone/menaquinone biosynthesis C-methylase UbiE